MARYTILFLSFNDAPFIIKSLRALYDSDLSDIQLIFSDDASQDDTVSLRNEFLRKNKFKESIKIHFADNKSNIGGSFLGKRFNEILSNVRTDFVIMQSADDIPELIRFEMMYSRWVELSKKKIIVHSRFKTIDETDAELGVSSNSPDRSLAMTIWRGGTGVLGATLAMHTDIVRYFAPMSDVVRFEDSVFTVRGKLLEGIHCIDEVLISYRRHSSNISGYNYSSQKSFQHFVRGKIGVYETIRRDLATCKSPRFYHFIVNVRVFIFSIWNICNFDSKSIQILFLLFGPNGLSVISRLKRLYNYGD